MFTTDAMTIPMRPTNSSPPMDERFRFVTPPNSAAAPNIPAAETNAAAAEAPVYRLTMTPIVRPIDAA